ncbi:hypothetical protein [Cupriavidus sp. 8B]
MPLEDGGRTAASAISNHQLPQGNVIGDKRYSPIPSALAAKMTVGGYSIVTSFDAVVQAIRVVNVVPVSVADHVDEAVRGCEVICWK